MAILTINGTAADDTIVVTATGADSGSYSINGGPAVAFSGVTQLAVTGGAGNDTLTIVNPTGGLFAPANGISYDGGGQAADSLEILGGVATQLTYTAGATHDAGTLMHTGAAGTQTIDFAGIAPITDTTAAATLVINGTNGNDDISVTDGGLVNGQQTTQVSAATFESIRFANKATVVINGNGGALDTVTFNNPTVAAGLTEMDVTNVNGVTQTGAVNYTNLSFNNTGFVELTLSTNHVTNLAAKVTGGNFFYHDADDITLTSVGGVNGISTNNGGIDIRTGNGAITVANTAAAVDVNAGTNGVILEAGSFGATDFAVQLGAGANVTGTGGVVIVADNIDLAGGATINGGNARVALAPFTSGTQIALGGADGANTLGLTDSELDGISARTLRIGDEADDPISFVSGIAPAGVNQLELFTAADIQDNHVGTDVTVARLVMNAYSGIGVTGTSAGIDTDVSVIEAEAITGGLDISNVGAVVVGGITSDMNGLNVFDSGDLRLTAGGSIELSDIDGLATVLGGAVSGNVFLTASGAGADVSSQVDKDAITAPAGNITVTAARDIVFGTAVTNQDSDVRANGSITLSAGRDIVIGGHADVISDIMNNDTGGGVTATAGRDITIVGSAAGIVAAGNAGADLTLSTGVNGQLSIGALALSSVGSTSGDVTINADRMAIASIVSIFGGQSVTLQPVSSDWGVDLGSTTDVAAQTLELSDAELDSIVTPILRVGSTAMTGTIRVTSQIASDGDYGTLSLRTGGAIIDGTAGEQTDITVDNLALRAGTGIGDSDSLDTKVSNLAFNNSGTGGVNIFNASGLTLAAVDGLAASNAGGFAQVVTEGPLTVATNVTASGLIDLVAEDTAAAGDNVTVLAGTTVRSTGGTVQLAAGDHVIAQAGSTIQSADLLVAYVDFGNVDATIGGTANLNGTVIAPTGVTILGAEDNDVLNGTPLADALVGSYGADLMRGGLGNDDYYVDDAGDAAIENAAEGIDRVLAATHFVLPDNVENLDLLGSDNLQGYGNGLANLITGNSGSNLLDGRAGADAMSGFEGNDAYFVDNAGDTVSENAGEGTDTVFATAHFALSANVENLILQGGADLQGYGNDLVNTLIGNSGSNLLDGRAGADAMTGGAGNDSYVVDNAGDQVVENVGEGADAVFATAHFTLSANVETLVLQGNADLQGYGNTLANTLFGNTGNNLLDGGAGADTMRGGAGNDTYFIDDAGDVIVENPNEGTDTVFSTVHFVLPANVETLVLQGNADLQGYGNTLANMLYGNTGSNLLDGRGGADVMRGGAGNDSYFVDDAGDVIAENLNEGADAVFATAHFALSANVETLVLQGSGNLLGTGNALANGIYGNAGNNTLNGGAGADLLTGNAGNDTFVFNAGQGNGDTVVDFTGNGAAAGDSLQFAGYGAGASFTNVDATHWQVNYNGGTAHDVITFMNGAAIDATDFMFV
jgi:Ca2+-binding RTX toxin-like protein